MPAALARPDPLRHSAPVADDGGLVLGVTATRNGLTPQQGRVAALILRGTSAHPIRELHHGDCVGGDADLDHIASALGVYRVIHPPDNPALRAYCLPEDADPYTLGRVLEPLPYKVRNKRIVHSCWCLLAFPATIREQPYGGTWSTVRYARSRGVPLVLVRPDGFVLPERTDVRLLALA